MQPMAYNRHKYSGELYKFVRKVVGDTTAVEYYFTNNIALTAGVDKTGRMTIKIDQPIAIGSLIANIKDANGNLILDDMIWQINGLEPVLNAFNNIESYRLRAVKFQGTI
jgi:hypothetical protein